MPARHSQLLWLLTLGAIACEPPNPERLAPEHAKAIGDSVSEVLALYVDRVNSWDGDGGASFYEDDPRFRWIEDGRIAYRSPDEVRKAHQALQGAFVSARLTLTDTRIVPLAPGVATVSAYFAQAMGDTTGGRFEFEGALTLTAIHTDDGWKFLSGHTSTRRTGR